MSFGRHCDSPEGTCRKCWLLARFPNGYDAVLVEDALVAAEAKIARLVEAGDRLAAELSLLGLRAEDAVINGEYKLRDPAMEAWHAAVEDK